jgi:hypothetical protein
MQEEGCRWKNRGGGNNPTRQWSLRALPGPASAALGWDLEGTLGLAGTPGHDAQQTLMELNRKFRGARTARARAVRFFAAPAPLAEQPPLQGALTTCLARSGKVRISSCDRRNTETLRLHPNVRCSPSLGR